MLMIKTTMVHIINSFSYGYGNEKVYSDAVQQVKLVGSHISPPKALKKSENCKKFSFIDLSCLISSSFVVRGNRECVA